MATPVVPWSELEAPFSKRNELPGVSRFQSHYACYHNRGFTSTEAEYLQARFNSPQGEMWLTVRLRIYVAPAETVLPIKKDRQFSPEFQVQVEVQSSQPIKFEGTVHAFALNEQQKNELTVGLGEGSRLPRSVSDSLLAAACGKQPVGSHDFKGTCSVPVSIVFEPEIISSLPEEHVAKKIADVTFSKLEFQKPSNMEPRYFLFAIAVGTSAAASDVSAVLFTPPTISICRAVQQRNKATRKLGYLNPDEMYAAVKSRGGEAYKTKATGQSKPSSGQGKGTVEAGAAQYPGDMSAQNGAVSTRNAQADRNQFVGQGRGTDARAGSSLHDKFWGNAGGNRAIQSRPMDAATAAIFGHAAVSATDPSPSKEPPKRAAVTNIANLFPRATSLASSGYEAVPMPKPSSTQVRESGISSHPIRVPEFNTPVEKVGAGGTGTPFDGSFAAGDLLSSLPFDTSSFGLSDKGHHGDALYSSLLMIPDAQGQAQGHTQGQRRQPDHLHTGAGPSGSNANQQKLAQVPPLFTGMPGADSGRHATDVAMRGAGAAGLRELPNDSMQAMPASVGSAVVGGANRTAFPDTLQGIAQQVAAVGLGGGHNGAAGAGMRGNANMGSHVGPPGQHPGGGRKQQPVESPFGGPPGAGMNWQLSSGTLGESFDPLMALELLESRAADGNPNMFESQPMHIEGLFSSFAASLDMPQAVGGGAAPAAGPAATGGPSRTPNSLERSRPTVPVAAAPATAAPDHQQQMQGGAAAACTRDRERSFRVESRPCDSMYQMRDEGTRAQRDVDQKEEPTPLPFPIRDDEEENDGPVATSFPHLEMSFDFGCLEAPATSFMPVNSTSREDATVPSTGAPSVNLGVTDAEMDIPDAADRGLVGAHDASASGAFSSATCGGLEAVYANVPDEDHTALQINQPAVARVPTVSNRN